MILINRKETLTFLETLARPPLELASQGLLRSNLEVEEKPNSNRSPYTNWELIGRLLCGMAPWFELELADSEEKNLQQELLTMAHKAIGLQVDSDSPDYTDFETLGKDYSQLVVDAAFLAQAFLRSPIRLWGELDKISQQRVLTVFRSLRTLRVYNNNWNLFSAEIEAALSLLDGQFSPGTIRHCYHLFEEWYLGDGWYSDGPRFSLDYYNSLVIHPMLLDISKAFSWEFPPGHHATYLQRSQRHVELLNRMSATDGTFPVMGRSLAYRGGVLHLVAQLALEESLPKSVSYGTVRTWLGRAIQKTLSPTSFRKDGILKIGLIEAQPSVGEQYISTGSLYLCSTIFLGLGLPSQHAYWQESPNETTFTKAWTGTDVSADKSIY